MSAAFFSIFFSTPRGSPAKGVPSGLYTSQIRRATLPCCGRQGRIVKVSRSGRRYWSLSLMRTKPSIELPSIIISLFTAFSIWLAVMATFFNWPKISVNCMRINSTSPSSTMRMMSSLLYLLIGRSLLQKIKRARKPLHAAPLPCCGYHSTRKKRCQGEELYSVCIVFCLYWGLTARRRRCYNSRKFHS